MFEQHNIAGDLEASFLLVPIFLRRLLQELVEDGVVEKACVYNKSSELLHAHIDRQVSFGDIGVTAILGSPPSSVSFRFMSTTATVLVLAPVPHQQRALQLKAAGSVSSWICHSLQLSD